MRIRVTAISVTGGTLYNGAPTEQNIIRREVESDDLAEDAIGEACVRPLLEAKRVGFGAKDIRLVVEFFE